MLLERYITKTSEEGLSLPESGALAAGALGGAAMGVYPVLDTYLKNAPLQAQMEWGDLGSALQERVRKAGAAAFDELYDAHEEALRGVPYELRGELETEFAAKMEQLKKNKNILLDAIDNEYMYRAPPSKEVLREAYLDLGKKYRGWAGKNAARGALAGALLSGAGIGARRLLTREKTSEEAPPFLAPSLVAGGALAGGIAGVLPGIENLMEEADRFAREEWEGLGRDPLSRPSKQVRRDAYRKAWAQNRKNIGGFAGAGVLAGALSGGALLAIRNKLLRLSPDKPLFGPNREKTSDVETELRPHQARVVRRMMEQPGLVVAHGLGSGKTLSSIAAGEELGGDVVVLPPASLKENYRKELERHLTDPRRSEFAIDSLQRAGVKQEVPEGDMLIVDEAHRLRNPTSKTRQLIRKRAQEFSKRMLLSATPIYNNPHDIAALVNIAAADSVLPASYGDFRREYIHRRKVQPGFFAKTFKGVRPGEVEEVKNKAQLKRIFKNWVDYHANSTEGFPERINETVEVPMTGKQYDMYQSVLGTAPSWLRHKIRKGMPVSKQESKDLNAFATAVRQLSLTPQSYEEGLSTEEALLDAPKITTAFGRFQDKLEANPEHRAVVYSNYLSGLDHYQHLLDEAGIPYGTFSGKLPKKVRDQAVRDYNEGRLKALLVSSAGGEGLDLKGTRQIQVLEPHFNQEKLEQVIGRGIRYGSHAHLPEDQRNVLVENYLALLPEKKGLSRLFGKSRGFSIDEYLTQRSAEKKALADQMLELMEQGTAEYEAGVQ